ncbi:MULTISPECIES: hypothetical protein [Sphingobium]|jgi:hypothetical protein|uniref:Uncharacterized protein n=1 Tax=Sphingobium yanoikuyae TaxID=13690 RepID=A0A085K812_SPHYA|nr:MULTISPECIES: hypothetical protein [Sphingobium]AYO78224.1 hypothetical protein EBF16_15835 [Sphingobium yanoikuyae]KFD28858.1 hypothetical protein IH86_07855 [Sphingobium yanoikuyae]KZC82765.1 hypothetical protein AYR46_02305 [Sphingobium yanoikuyae]MDV3480302.1 hypothetical protein [Sphingobium yanoikuyae]SHL84782.1 hypothetical protein SAMN05518668_103411 [Sphingobium sp. YR657]
MAVLSIPHFVARSVNFMFLALHGFQFLSYLSWYFLEDRVGAGTDETIAWLSAGTAILYLCNMLFLVPHRAWARMALVTPNILIALLGLPALMVGFADPVAWGFLVLFVTPCAAALIGFALDDIARRSPL